MRERNKIEYQIESRIRSLCFIMTENGWRARQEERDGTVDTFDLKVGLEEYLAKCGSSLARRMGLFGTEVELEFQQLEPNWLGRLLGKKPILRAEVTARSPQEER